VPGHCRHDIGHSVLEYTREPNHCDYLCHHPFRSARPDDRRERSSLVARIQPIVGHTPHLACFRAPLDSDLDEIWRSPRIKDAERTGLNMGGAGGSIRKTSEAEMRKRNLRSSPRARP
jgi:hypothetical protein